ncbi:MAG: hypothetical protein BRD48_03260 [Bacteroidetes bacterium QS_9_68_14]|nr:MAG: hypothetical protein BRD48_03260 [Bacteroidetes bacterium QS_9_68_14]
MASPRDSRKRTRAARRLIALSTCRCSPSGRLPPGADLHEEALEAALVRFHAGAGNDYGIDDTDDFGLPAPVARPDGVAHALFREQPVAGVSQRPLHEAVAAKVTRRFPGRRAFVEGVGRGVRHHADVVGERGGSLRACAIGAEARGALHLAAVREQGRVDGVGRVQRRAGRHHEHCGQQNQRQRGEPIQAR